MASVTDQLVEKILARCSVYRAAFEVDVIRMSREHGHGPVREALEIIKNRDGDVEVWDQAGHARAVQHAIGRVLAERQGGGDEPEPSSSWWR